MRYSYGESRTYIRRNPNNNCVYSQRAHTCTENVLKARFQDVQNINSEDALKS